MVAFRIGVAEIRPAMVASHVGFGDEYKLFGSDLNERRITPLKRTSATGTGIGCAIGAQSKELLIVAVVSKLRNPASCTSRNVESCGLVDEHLSFEDIWQAVAESKAIAIFTKVDHQILTLGIGQCEDIFLCLIVAMQALACLHHIIVDDQGRTCNLYRSSRIPRTKVCGKAESIVADYLLTCKADFKSLGRVVCARAEHCSSTKC